MGVSVELLQAVAHIIVSAPANMAGRLPFVRVIECASVRLVCPSVSGNRQHKLQNRRMPRSAYQSADAKTRANDMR
jgi:hypothetical protein